MIVKCGSCLWRGTHSQLRYPLLYKGHKEDGGADEYSHKPHCPRCGQTDQLYDIEAGQEIDINGQ